VIAAVTEIVSNKIHSMSTRKDLINDIAEQSVDALNHAIRSAHDSIMFDVVYGGYQSIKKTISKKDIETLSIFGFTKDLPLNVAVTNHQSVVTIDDVDRIFTRVAIKYVRESYQIFRSGLLLEIINKLNEIGYLEELCNER
jgi:hypothetical protein